MSEKITLTLTQYELETAMIALSNYTGHHKWRQGAQSRAYRKAQAALYKHQRATMRAVPLPFSMKQK